MSVKAGGHVIVICPKMKHDWMYKDWRSQAAEYEDHFLKKNVQLLKYIPIFLLFACVFIYQTMRLYLNEHSAIIKVL